MKLVYSNKPTSANCGQTWGTTLEIEDQSFARWPMQAAVACVGSPNCPIQPLECKDPTEAGSLVFSAETESALWGQFASAREFVALAAEPRIPPILRVISHGVSVANNVVEPSVRSRRCLFECG